MSDDPGLDYIASQKSISDRGAALGHNQGPPLSSGSADNSAPSTTSDSPGGRPAGFIFEALRLFLVWAGSWGWEIIKMVFAMFSRRR